MNLIQAVETLKKNNCTICAYGGESTDECDISYCDNREAINVVINALKKQKNAYWIRQKSIYGYEDTYACSECGRVVYAELEEDLEDYPYCHCGARMEGEKK